MNIIIIYRDKNHDTFSRYNLHQYGAAYNNNIIRVNKMSDNLTAALIVTALPQDRRTANIDSRRMKKKLLRGGVRSSLIQFRHLHDEKCTERQLSDIARQEMGKYVV